MRKIKNIIKVLYYFVYCGVVFSIGISSFPAFLIFLDYLSDGVFRYEQLIKVIKASFLGYIIMAIPLGYAKYKEIKSQKE
ncbi:hypothetical protein ACLS0M_05025 [Avibacterium avium]|uniref:hypothetical protein n=1 Tax=Avibacterium avium TaxID=751 RepID=UPI003BF8FF2F